MSDTCHNVKGDLLHLLIVCPALEHTRHRLHSLWCSKSADCPPLHSLVLRILGSSPESQVRFILDSTPCPELIKLIQMFGKEIQDRVLYLTRTWAFSIHRQKLKLLGRWPENPKKITTRLNPISFPILPKRPQQTKITDNNSSDSYDRDTSAVIVNDMINDLVFPGSTNPHPTTPPPASSSSVPYDVQFPVPALPTDVHYDQPSDAMPEPTSLNISSNFSPSDDRVVGLNENLVGHGEGHGVTGCSPGSVAGHHQSESARPPCQSYGQPNCLSAAQSAFSTLV